MRIVRQLCSFAHENPWEKLNCSSDYESNFHLHRLLFRDIKIIAKMFKSLTAIIYMAMCGNFGALRSTFAFPLGLTDCCYDERKQKRRRVHFCRHLFFHVRILNSAHEFLRFRNVWLLTWEMFYWCPNWANLKSYWGKKKCSNIVPISGVFVKLPAGLVCSTYRVKYPSYLKKAKSQKNALQTNITRQDSIEVTTRPTQLKELYPGYATLSVVSNAVQDPLKAAHRKVWSLMW